MGNIDRRKLIKSTLLSIGGLTLGAKVAKAATCDLTPEQVEGPFYPIVDRLDKDNDLTYVKNKNLKAKGEVITIKGVVTNDACQPIKGALVEIWQACGSGKYDHPGDTNTAKLDENFQYWGRSLTNEKGEYFFKTIKPGSYPATPNWTRPPHIHLKVHLRGFAELTTQFYFQDEKFNRQDRILASLSKQEQKLVTIELKRPVDANNLPISGPKQGTFNITLNGI